MPKYRVKLTRTVTCRQRAEVVVEATSQDMAVEQAWDGDIDWKTGRVFESDDHAEEVEEILREPAVAEVCV